MHTPQNFDEVWIGAFTDGYWFVVEWNIWECYWLGTLEWWCKVLRAKNVATFVFTCFLSTSKQMFACVFILSKVILMQIVWQFNDSKLKFYLSNIEHDYHVR